jgi:hypothetical protein
MAFHDENGNGRLDKNFLGVPTEPYGFSNDVQPWVAAAEFREDRLYARQRRAHGRDRSHPCGGPGLGLVCAAARLAEPLSRGGARQERRLRA